MNMTYEQAIELIKSTDGPVITVRVALMKKLGLGLSAAAFVSQAVYLSTHAHIKREKWEPGWFFLEQTGDGGDKEDGLYKQLGSWQQSLGLSKKDQENIRKKLLEKGLLYEMPSPSRELRGDKGKGNKDTAFLTTRLIGTPPRLYYHVDPAKYVKFIMGLQ